MKRLMVGIGVMVITVLLLSTVACGKSSISDGDLRYGDSGYLYLGQQTTTSTPASGWGGNTTYTTTTKAAATTTVPKYASNISEDSGTETSWSSISIPIERMVVRSGSVVLVVDDVAASLDSVVKIANDLTGYVVSSQKWKEGERTMGTISIRVPSGSYDQALASLRNLAMDVVSENTSSQDVTQEYVDLESRLKNLEASQVQLLKIMESATKTEDVLSVQRELTNVNGQIEQTKGRMQYLQQTSAMSLIEVKLQQALLEVSFYANKGNVKPGEKNYFEARVSGGFTPYNYIWDFGDGDSSNVKSPIHSYKETGNYTVSLKVTDDKGYTNTFSRTEYINVVGGWGPGSTVTSAWNGFLSFGRVLVDILVWVGIFSPIWLIVGGIILWNIYRRRKKNRAGA